MRQISTAIGFVAHHNDFQVAGIEMRCSMNEQIQTFKSLYSSHEQQDFAAVQTQFTARRRSAQRAETFEVYTARNQAYTARFSIIEPHYRAVFVFAEHDYAI